MTGNNNSETSLTPWKLSEETETETKHMEAEKDFETLIELNDVSINWGRRQVLENVSLTVRRGDFIAITGPNGGGKTTLLRILLGLLTPVSGMVTRHTADLRIGYLPQKNMIDSHFPISVREVIASGLLADKNLDSEIRSQLFDDAVRSVELAEHLDRPIGLLSGGQLQRALLGRAIIAKPDVLVLDEPLSYIDKHFEHHLYELIRHLAERTTIILVSHEMSTIAGMANRHFIVDRTLHQCSAHNHFIHSECDD